MDVIELVARLLFAAGFLISPSGVLASAPRIAATPMMRPIPPAIGTVLVRISCLMSMGGAVLIALGVWPDLGALLVIGFLVPATFTMHRFWDLEKGSLPRKQKRDVFLSNAGLVGGALFLFLLVNDAQHVDLALVAQPLFGRL